MTWVTEFEDDLGHSNRAETLADELSVVAECLRGYARQRWLLQRAHDKLPKRSRLRAEIARELRGLK